MKKRSLAFFLVIFIAIAPSGLFGQEGLDPFDPFADPFEVPEVDDDPFAGMFSDDDMIEVVESDPTGARGQAAYEDLLKSDGILIGGRMFSTLSADWGWRDISENVTDSLSFSLGTDIFFDARPSSELRVFFKFRTEYPFNTTELVGTSIIEKVSFVVRELYTDVTLDKSILFRFGKQTVNWGVGRFFSPADVIALVPIDPQNPDAEREGPLALRMSAPVLQDHTFDAYVIGNESVRRLKDLGLGARLELVFQPLELGLGVAYQQDRPFRTILTARMPVSDFAFFGEGRLSFGRLGGKIKCGGTTSDDDNLYFSGTTGLTYANTDNKVSFGIQYMFNGEGYDDPELIGDAYQAVVAGNAPASAFTYFGKHYLGLSIGSSEFLHEDLSASVMAFANFSDLSGIATASLTWRAFDGVSLGPVVRFGWGEEPSEFFGFTTGLPGNEVVVSPRNSFGRFGFGLQFTIGGGKF